MLAEAEGLLAEGARLREEAYNMDPTLRPKKTRSTTKKKAVAKKNVATKA